MKIPHLKSVTLKDDYRCLPKGMSFELKSVTLLVGDQGCGKSSMLELLQENSKLLNIELSMGAQVAGVNSYFFDSEKMNPRIGSMDDYTNPNGTDRSIGVAGLIASKFQSHGEVLKKFTVDMIGKAKDCVLLIDEPEAALSLKNQFQLIKVIEKAEKQNSQVIIATHCLPLIEHFDEVYDMENKKWVKSNEYISNLKS